MDMGVARGRERKDKTRERVGERGGGEGEGKVFCPAGVVVRRPALLCNL